MTMTRKFKTCLKNKKTLFHKGSTCMMMKMAAKTQISLTRRMMRILTVLSSARQIFHRNYHLKAIKRAHPQVLLHMLVKKLSKCLARAPSIWSNRPTDSLPNSGRNDLHIKRMGQTLVN